MIDCIGFDFWIKNLKIVQKFFYLIKVLPVNKEKDKLKVECD